MSFGVLFYVRQQGRTQKNPYITDICARWSGDDHICEWLEETVGIAAREKFVCIQAQRASAFEGCFLGNRTCGRTVAVDAVTTSAQQHEVFGCGVEFYRATQGCFEISAAAATAAHWTGKLAA